MEEIWSSAKMHAPDFGAMITSSGGERIDVFCKIFKEMAVREPPADGRDCVYDE